MADIKTIYVSRLDERTTIHEVIGALSDFGTILNYSWPGQFNGFCWVSASLSDAQNILNQHKKLALHGRQINLVTSPKTLSPPPRNFAETIHRGISEWKQRHLKELGPSQMMTPRNNANNTTAISGRSRSPVSRLGQQNSAPYSSARKNDNSQHGPCFDFINKGRCSYGKDCKYSHDTNPATTATSRDHKLADTQQIAPCLPSLPLRKVTEHFTTSGIRYTESTKMPPAQTAPPSDITVDILHRHNEGLEFISGFVAAPKEQIRLDCDKGEIACDSTQKMKAEEATLSKSGGANILQPASDQSGFAAQASAAVTSVSTNPPIEASTTNAICPAYPVSIPQSVPVTVDLTTTTTSTVRRTVLSSRRNNVDLTKPTSTPSTTVFKAVGGCLQLECDNEEVTSTVVMTPSAGRGRSFTQPAWMTEKSAITPADNAGLIVSHNKDNTSIVSGQFDDIVVKESSINSKDVGFQITSEVMSSASTFLVTSRDSSAEQTSVGIADSPPQSQSAPPGRFNQDPVNKAESVSTPAAAAAAAAAGFETTDKLSPYLPAVSQAEYDEVEVDYSAVSSDDDGGPAEESEVEVKQNVTVEESVAVDSSPSPQVFILQRLDDDEGAIVESTAMKVTSEAEVNVAADVSVLPTVVSLESVPTHATDAETTNTAPPTLMTTQTSSVQTAVVEEEEMNTTETQCNPVNPAHYLVPTVEVVPETAGILWYMHRLEASDARKRKVVDGAAARQQDEDRTSKIPRVTSAQSITDKSSAQSGGGGASKWKRALSWLADMAKGDVKPEKESCNVA